jgi:hypothetical protein
MIDVPVCVPNAIDWWCTCAPFAIAPLSFGAGVVIGIWRTRRCTAPPHDPFDIVAQWQRGSDETLLQPSPNDLCVEYRVIGEHA